ncbi:SDR family NAD(P)-dependent oxidoreductase [Flavihumibacter fluvii]|uniref:SDR family NAD(P)-dependent oxidoreductase n=1 Tax=Flavihumibacter fluvii TaxID=2838157 RepID=UPI001BDEA9D4|nr:SDR family NAD(P)-dependent oxidoreductase [Flavihumibacter fluvii]ULQ51770.1 SDR family NAD(P)-dependent oxidoreductase [Flavihumibacter fluvii]
MNNKSSRSQVMVAVLLITILVGSVKVVAQEKREFMKKDVPPIDSTYFSKDRLKGRVIVITGGARGIGRATAIRASREGAAVVIGDWLEIQGEATAQYIRNKGGKALFVKTDIRSTEDCNNLIARAVSLFGKIDGALLNAGVMDGTFSGDPFDYDKQKEVLPSRVDAASDKYWDNVMEVNATGTFKSMRSVIRQLLVQGNGGAIVTVGSIAGLTGLAGNPAYVASKHAVNGLTRSAAIDYAPYGIRVNSVNMAATETPMTDKAFEFVKEVKKRGIQGMGGAKTESLLMMNDTKHRMATVWEQASVILFLLSDEASNLTGALYPTDGGWTAY